MLSYPAKNNVNEFRDRKWISHLCFSDVVLIINDMRKYSLIYELANVAVSKDTSILVT